MKNKRFLTHSQGFYDTLLRGHRLLINKGLKME
jgi:hypothetical protein